HARPCRLPSKQRGEWAHLGRCTDAVTAAAVYILVLQKHFHLIVLDIFMTAATSLDELKPNNEDKFLFYKTF
ncbi:hypothetical protein NPN23_25300, partial [Vibrio parahaemolyticus]|nr:hypothetical protein [Vibrio parahaemolyticus]